MDVLPDQNAATSDEAPRKEPPPRKCRRGLKLLLGFSLLVTVLLVGAGVGLYIYALDLYQRPGPLQTETTVTIERGSGLNAIAQTLFYEGVIENTEIFSLAAKIEGQAGALKAGEYAVPAEVSMQEVLALLVEGKTVQHRVTVPEGLTSWDIVQIVNAATDLGGEAIEEIPPEGSLLPDTYFFQRGESRQHVLDRMRQAQREALEALWPTRAEGLPFDTQAEWIALASIIEKETGLAEERGLVAGVFVNRLNQGMLLQSDPTVIYAVTKGQGGPLGRGIRKSELKSDDPYNTYTNKGLPPGPIANPGREALEAAIRPGETKFIFFVADGIGGHAFSETLVEHEANVRAWRKIEKERKQSD